MVKLYEEKERKTYKGIQLTENNYNEVRVFLYTEFPHMILDEYICEDNEGIYFMSIDGEFRCLDQDIMDQDFTEAKE